jgi:hypothetical protein
MPWDGDEPLVGELEPQTLAALCRILAGHTDPALYCFFALWEGWGGSPAASPWPSSEPWGQRNRPPRHRQLSPKG